MSHLALEWSVPPHHQQPLKSRSAGRPEVTAADEEARGEAERGDRGGVRALGEGRPDGGGRAPRSFRLRFFLQCIHNLLYKIFCGNLEGIVGMSALSHLFCDATLF